MGCIGSPSVDLGDYPGTADAFSRRVRAFSTVGASNWIGRFIRHRSRWNALSPHVRGGFRSAGRRLCLDVARGSHARNRGFLSNIRMLRVRSADDSIPVGIDIMTGVAQLRCRFLAPSPFKEGVFNPAVRDLTCDSQPVRWRGDSRSHQPRAAFVSPETRLRSRCETTSVQVRRAF